MPSPDGALSGRVALWTLDRHCHRGTEGGLGLYGPSDGGHGEVLLEVRRKRTLLSLFFRDHRLTGQGRLTLKSQ